MKLREYQQRAISDLRAAYTRGHRAPCLVLPTGGGKTVIAAAIVQGALERGNRVLFLVHRQELLTQSVAKLESAGIHDLRIIQAGSDLGSPTAPVSVASIPTLTRWTARQPDAELVIVDEAHHVVAKTWSKLTDHYRKSMLLGLSATPQRADGKPLGDVFDSLVVGSTVRELTDAGHLVPCRVYGPPPDMDANAMALSPAQAYLRHAEGQRAVVFCVSVPHALIVAAEMNAAGIPCGVVHGDMDRADRKQTLADLDTGKLRAVASCHVLTEGWDSPNVAVCILARKPQHTGLYLQMVGRVLRPAPGKTHATLIDLRGSVWVHGPPDIDREFSLDGKGISKGDRDAIRQCMVCGGVFKAGPLACPLCGEVLPRKPSELPESLGVGLVDISTVKPPVRSVSLAISAKFAGICRICHQRFPAGTRIFWSSEQKPRHALCGSADALAEANRLLAAVN